MMYHVEVRSHYSGMGHLDARVAEFDSLPHALETAYVMAMDALDKGADEVTDIHILKDEDWCSNRWNAGWHFTMDNLKMGFRMYRNEVQE